MPFTRRGFAFCGVALLSGAAGCSEASGSDQLEEVRLNLSNRTAESLTFHFALAANDGLGEWQAFDLDAEGERRVVVEATGDREFTGYHAIAGDKQISGSLLGQGSEYACLELDFRIEAEEIVSLLPTNQSGC